MSHSCSEGKTVACLFSLNSVVFSLLRACVFLRIVTFHLSRGMSEFVSLHLLRFEDTVIARHSLVGILGKVLTRD